MYFQTAGKAPDNNSQVLTRKNPIPSPWLASVLIDDAFSCEGYLISNKYILITANCVVFGTYFDIMLGDGEILQTTNTAWVHPGYNETSFNDNIALLELTDPIEFTENIHAIGLPDAGQVVQEGDLLTVCSHEFLTSMVCQEDIPVLTQEECEAFFPGLASAFCLISSADSCLVRTVVAITNNHRFIV